MGPCIWEAQGPDRGGGGAWNLAELEGWISEEEGSLGTVSGPGRSQGQGRYRGLEQGPWMERWLGPCLAAVRLAEAVSPAAGGGGMGRPGKKVPCWAG